MAKVVKLQGVIPGLTSTDQTSIREQHWPRVGHGFIAQRGTSEVCAAGDRAATSAASTTSCRTAGRARSRRQHRAVRGPRSRRRATHACSCCSAQRRSSMASASRWSSAMWSATLAHPRLQQHGMCYSNRISFHGAWTQNSDGTSSTSQIAWPTRRAIRCGQPPILSSSTFGAFALTVPSMQTYTSCSRGY